MNAYLASLHQELNYRLEEKISCPWSDANSPTERRCVAVWVTPVDEARSFFSCAKFQRAGCQIERTPQCVSVSARHSSLLVYICNAYRVGFKFINVS